MLDDPDYITGLGHDDRERYGRRNVLVLSLSVAAHELLQLVGFVADCPRVGRTGPRVYYLKPWTWESRSELCRLL